MKTRLYIIIGIIIIFGIIIVIGISQIEWDKVTQENLYNLTPTERKEFIMKYTDTQFSGEFNDNADIINLQNEYAVGEPITFTVATWGYGHPCQSPSFVYYYEIKDSTNIVFEDKFIRWCQPLKESDYMYYYQELDSSQTAKASDFDIFPVFNEAGSYIISVDDKVEYEFQIIEKITINDSTFEMNRNELQQVLDSCNTPIRNSSYYYSNETHSINTFTCEWKEHENLPNSEFLCIPYTDNWVTLSQITNQTHIFDKDSCTWKVDRDYDIINSKGCPQFCPKDEEQKRFEDLTCDEILKDLIPGLKFDTDDSTFNQERIWNCMKDKEDPGPQLGGPIIVDSAPLPYEQLQKVLNYCEEKRQAEASNWIRPDGTDWAMKLIGLEWHNSTHYIGNNGCMWEDITTEISSTTATFGPKIYPLPEGLPEVMAFYAQYPTTQASVREDHMSYFAGSSDAAFIRMNVFYDNDKTLDHIETKCYFQKVLQFEIAQEDIVNSLEKYDCKK